MSANWLLTVSQEGRVLQLNHAALQALGDVRGLRCCDVIRAIDGQGHKSCAVDCSAGLLGGAEQRDRHGRVARRMTGRVVCDAVGDIVVVSVTGVGPVLESTTPLSRRERDVLAEVAAGGTNTEIAERLGIRPATVRTHLEHVREKLGVKTRAEAVAHAIAMGQIRLGPSE